MEPKEKKAFEPSGLVPRSIVRTFERFRQQLLPGSETAAIREYRISRYQVLVSARCLFTLLIIPIATNWLVSSWLLSPLVEHFWNTQQNEIFLNSYQEERAFAELESFSEKLFFESLLNTTNTINVDNSLTSYASPYLGPITNNNDATGITDAAGFALQSIGFVDKEVMFDSLANYYNPVTINIFDGSKATIGVSTASPVGVVSKTNFVREFEARKSIGVKDMQAFSSAKPLGLQVQPATDSSINKVNTLVKVKPLVLFHTQPLTPKEYKTSLLLSSASANHEERPWGVGYTSNANTLKNLKNKEGLFLQDPEGGTRRFFVMQNHNQELRGIASNSLSAKQRWSLVKPATILSSTSSSAMTYDNSLKIKEKVQNKILELAVYYNQQTIISITNIIGDIVSLVTLGCLFIWMKPEITILKSFLIEAIYSLSDTTKSFLLILLTDLLVGFHSPRGWETALELLLKHFGLPENQDFVFLFVATFPVLLDTVFKYWIFRHLNKISPSTVATYHSMIE